MTNPPDCAAELPTRTSLAGGIASSYPAQLWLLALAALLVAVMSLVQRRPLMGLVCLLVVLGAGVLLKSTLRMLRSPGSVFVGDDELVIRSPLLGSPVRIPLENVWGAWDEDVRHLELNYSSSRVACLFVGLGVDRRWTVALRTPVTLNNVPLPARIMHTWWSGLSLVATTPYNGQRVGWFSVRLPGGTSRDLLPEIGDTAELKKVNVNA